MAANIPSANDQVRVFLWALPRSVSTAFTKCMSFVDGADIWFEPYLYSYHNEKFRDPAFLENLPAARRESFVNFQKQIKPLLASVPRGNRKDNSLFDFPWVKTQLETSTPDKKLTFVKDMAHVLNGRYEHLPSPAAKFRHTFLIRNPYRMFPSFRKMMMMTLPEDTSADIDITKDEFYDVDKIYKYTYDLWKYAKENLDNEAIIIDGSELAAHPEKLLPKYFEALGIPYRDDYLTWDESSDIIVKWHASFETLVAAHVGNVIKSAVESSRFIPEAKEAPRRETLTPDVLKCIDSALPFYNEMFENRIKP